MAKTASMLDADIDRILWPVIQHGQIVNRQLNTPQEAKLYERELSNIESQLRNYKKDINLIKKQVHLTSSSKQTTAGTHPFVGIFAGKKAANHLRAVDRQNMRIREHNALVPYDKASDRIDRCINYLQQVKLEVDKAIQRGDLE